MVRFSALLPHGDGIKVNFSTLHNRRNRHRIRILLYSLKSENSEKRIHLAHAELQQKFRSVFIFGLILCILILDTFEEKKIEIHLEIEREKDLSVQMRVSVYFFILRSLITSGSIRRQY